MIRPKSAQSANNAAVVIILIAVMIILYILFLPPEERAALLGEEPSGGGGSYNPGSGSYRTTLYSKALGRITPEGQNVIVHSMPSFLVYTITNPEELKRLDSLYVRNSAFGDQQGEVIFYYEPQTMSDLKLSFNVKDHTGRLKITLNENAIYEGEITAGSPNPITLPKEFLTSKNMLVFTVSSPGIAFWTYNDYSLQNVLVSGKITDYSASMSEQHFSVSDLEYEKLERALLEYLPDCPPRSYGQVQVLINARPIFSGKPDCGVRASIEVGREFFRPGDNTLVATTSSGTFLLDAPKITTILRQDPQPVSYFTVSPQVFDAIYYRGRDVWLTLRFADSTKVKRGTLDINGLQKIYFETQDFIYTTLVDPEVVMQGSNSVRVLAQNEPLEVVELKIEVI